MGAKRKVTIVGGGMGGISAAWHLLQQEPDGYEITIYEKAGILGGKAASVRGTQDKRVEEHGIHILMGFYHCLFRMLRDCYAELPSVNPEVGGCGFRKTFREALTGTNYLQITDRSGPGGEAKVWPVEMPANAGRPGDVDPGESVDIVDLVHSALRALANFARDIEPGALGVATQTQRSEALLSIDALTLEVDALAARLSAEDGGGLEQERTNALRVTEKLRDSMERYAVDKTLADDVRHAFIQAYYALLHVRGVFHDRLFTEAAFMAQKINELDYKGWLRGFSGKLLPPAMSWDSALVNAVYDLVFSQGSGFAAGAAAYDALLMLLTYRGHVFYRMNGGTGDIVFLPLYFVLKARGVKFELFHELHTAELRTVDGQQTVTALELIRRGATAPTDRQLFVCGAGSLAWTEPAIDLHEEQRVRVTDFDEVVLAIPPAAFSSVHGPLRELPALARATQLATVSTQAFQLWTKRTPSAMGWRHPEGMLGSFDLPFDAWADMPQLIREEEGRETRAAGYFCGIYDGPEPASPEQALAHVKQAARSWIDGSLHKLWPSFEWSDLVDHQERSGPERLKDQFFKANISSSDLYVASAPGKLHARPTESGVANLYLAGDWVWTDLNAGCIEAAARGGRNAALAMLSKRKLAGVEPRVAAGRYVERRADWVLKQPILMHDTSVHARAFLSSSEAAREACREFNRPGFQVEPLPGPLARVLLMFTTGTDRLTSESPDQADWGSIPERALGFLRAVRVDSARYRGVAFLCPYMFVDNEASLLAGREIYGIPKQLAAFEDWPSITHVPDSLTVNTLILKKKGEHASRGPLLSLTEHDKETAPDDGLFPALRQLVDSLTEHGILKAPLLFRKQFRDVADPQLACCEQLILCHARVHDVREVRPSLRAVRLSLGEYFHPSLSELGIGTAAVSRFDIRMKLNLRLPLGEILGA